MAERQERNGAAGGAYDRLFQTKSDTIAQLIQQDILEGRLLPGARLLQEEVAARYGSSTTPVREAFHKLESGGLLVRHPHRGYLVASRSADEIDDIWRVRFLVEGLEAELAAPRLTDADLAELDRLTAEIAAAGGDLAQYTRLNTLFHDTIYRAAGRPTLFAISKGLRDPSFTVLAQYFAAGGTMDTLHAEHEAILAACRARDASALQRATQAHIENARLKVVAHARGIESVLARHGTPPAE